jgi:hypothetical protein
MDGWMDVCICMHVCQNMYSFFCMYASTLCMYTPKHLCVYLVLVCMYVHTYVHIYVRMHSSFFVRIQARLYMYIPYLILVCMYVRTCICMYVCMYVPMCAICHGSICVRTHINTYIHMHTHTHHIYIYIYTYIPAPYCADRALNAHSKCIYIHTHTHIYIYIYIYIFVHHIVQIVLSMCTLSLPEIFEFSNAFTVAGVILGLYTCIQLRISHPDGTCVCSWTCMQLMRPQCMYACLCVRVCRCVDVYPAENFSS